MKIKNILVAVDGSESSNRALDFALELAENYTASVLILNVFEALPIDATTPLPEVLSTIPTRSTPNLLGEIMSIHEGVLNKNFTSAVAKHPDLVLSSMLREGNPAHEIVNAAKEGGFDLIVVGHGGLGDVGELLMGSVSERVAHLAPCTVLVVK